MKHYRSLLAVAALGTLAACARTMSVLPSAAGSAAYSQSSAAGPTLDKTSEMTSSTGAIPLAYDIGKSKGDLSPGEAGFLALHASAAALNFFGSPGNPYPCIEPGVYAQAASIRRAAAADGVPGPKLAEYWGFALTGHQGYCALQDPVFLAHQAAWMSYPPSDRFDITQSAARAWWDGAADKMISNGNLDFLYIDGAENAARQNGTPWADAKLALFKGLSPRTIINGNVVNCQLSLCVPGSAVVGLMTEGYARWSCGASLNDPPKAPSVSQDVEILKAGYAVGVAGYDFWLKAWPGKGSFLCNAFNNLPYAKQVAQMKANIPFALASALAINVPPHTYLAYSWGYDSCSWYPCVGSDPATYGVAAHDYAALFIGYGAPVGAPAWTGNVVKRTYVSGVNTTLVTVDLDKNSATIKTTYGKNGGAIAQRQLD